MNRYAQDMLSRRGMRDGRNPYGSRGGYVVSSRGRGRDRASEDMARGRGRGRGRGGAMYGGSDYNYGSGAGGYSGSERGGQSDYRDYAEYDYGNYNMDYEHTNADAKYRKAFEEKGYTVWAEYDGHVILKSPHVE